MAKIKGICKNIDACDLAADKVEQEAEKSNFVCSECGKPLYSMNEGGGNGGNGTDSGNLKKIIVGVVALAVIGGGAYWGFFRGDAKSDAKDSGTEAVVTTDSVPVAIDNNVMEADVDSINKAKVTNENPSPTKGDNVITEKAAGGTNSSNLGYATYEGPMNGGKPHGVGGTLTIKNNHTIDLKDGNGGALNVSPGDKIINTKFKNGALMQGEVHRQNGERKYFNIAG